MYWFPAFRFCRPYFATNRITQAIVAFDKAVENCMTDIRGRGFSKEQRELACLPIANGGLGIPWSFFIAWPAYVASRIQSAELQRSLASTVASTSNR
jgi:hypothetical protein